MQRGGTTQATAAVVDGRTLRLSHTSKVLYPDAGFTKGQVLAYYLRIAPVLLPHLAHRPATTKRYPDGVDGTSFYQKHAPAHRPAWVPTAEVAAPSSRRAGAAVTHIVIEDAATLLWVANLAALEIHTPMWRLPDVGRPDLLVFDLDPGDPATVVECARVALLLRPQLAEAGLTAVPKTSGSKGLQLYAPATGMSSQHASAFARGLARELAAAHPELVVAEMARAARPGKVFIDWSQNNAAKTTVAPYSLRARPTPTVSTPLAWDEVESCEHPQDLVFTADDVLHRVESRGDLWAGVLTAAGD